MTSVYKSVGPSVYSAVHNPLRVPSALLGAGGPTGPFDPSDVSGLQHRYLDVEPHLTQVGNRWFARDNVGSNHAMIKTPCLHGAPMTAMHCEVGLFQLDGNFELSAWVKYEGDNTTGNGPMFFGGGLNSSGAAFQAHVWYRPSNNAWYFAVDGSLYRINAVVNPVLEDNQWHFLQSRRTGTLYEILVDGVVVASATGVVTRFSLRQIMGTFSNNYSVDGMMADFRVNNAGVITHFPLQDGEGNGTNRNIAWHRSDGASGVIVNALVGSTVADWWGAKTGGHVNDWSIQYGGRIGSNGEFVLGNINDANCADGQPKTRSPGKLGNPFSRLNLNSSWSDTLNRRAVSSEFMHGQNTNSQVAPFDSAFNRVSADGTDRILIYSSAKTETDLTNLRSYTNTPVPQVWSLDDLPTETANEYFAAITANSGTISTANQTAVLNLLNGLHANGLFDDVLVLYLFHGNHLNSARLNAINPTLLDGASAITWTGAPILNPSGGITPSAGNFGVAFHPFALGLPSQTTFNGAGLGFFSTSNAATSERTIGNTLHFNLSPKFSGTSAFSIAGSADLTGAAQDLSGFHFATREPSSDNLAAYRNGTAYLTGVRNRANGYANPGDIGRCHIGGCSNNGTGNLTSTTPIRLAICTRGLLAAQVATLNTLVQTYITELV